MSIPTGRASQGRSGKESPAVLETQETRIRLQGGEDALKEGMAAHSSLLAWRIPWTEEPGRLQSMEFAESDMTEATEHVCTHA